MEGFKNFRVIIFLPVLLFSLTQAINPFEGSFIRQKCLKGTKMTGCKGTLLEAYKKTKMAESDNNINEAETHVMLFTNNNKNNPEYLDECDGDLPKNTNFDPKWNIEIIVHGFMEGVCQAAWLLEIKDQLLHRGDYNVIIVDWSWGNQIDYYDALNNAEVVGKQIAFVAHNIMKLTGIKGEKFHIIGHSLGAQIAGHAGFNFQKIADDRFRRITGLDPAGPGYKEVPLSQRLDKSDATMVDIIHTNGGECMPLSMGYYEPMGHADFYPNGGKEQLSCIPDILHSYLKGDTLHATGSLLLPACYHKQSVSYYIVTINPCTCQFVGVECENYEAYESGKCRSCGKDGSNCAVMGMDWEEHYMKKGNHSYYLDTTMSCPYCDNKPIKIEGFTMKKKYSCFSKLPTLLPNIG